MILLLITVAIAVALLALLAVVVAALTHDVQARVLDQFRSAGDRFAAITTSHEGW